MKKNELNHPNQEEEENEKTIHEKLKYGFKGFRPDCLQILNKPIFFLVWISIVMFGHGFSATGLNNTAITSIEKRYGLKTTQIALFPMCQHIIAGFFAMLVCYFGHKHRPFSIAFGCCSLALGLFIISIPHYLVPVYTAGVSLDSDTCRLNSSATATLRCSAEENESDINVLPIFLLGYVFVGIGVTPLYSLGFAHVDEITSRKNSNIYYAIMSVVSIVGPSAGFLIANPILNIFVDIKQPENSNLTPVDRNWVGAWWIAYLLGGSIMFLPVIPLLGFPKIFPNTETIKHKKRNFEDTIEKADHLNYNLKTFWPALKSLLKNKSYVFTCLSVSLEMLSIAGFATFLPKLVETQFHKTAAEAASSVGFVMLPGSILGISFGAYLCRRFSWTCRQLLTFNVVILFINTLLISVILFGCDSRDVIGATSNYYNSTTDEITILNPCNQGCHCNTQFYKPVCSVHDQKTFYSPCHAGCFAKNFVDQHYTNCTCVESPKLKVAEGRCIPECNVFIYFMFGLVITIFFAVATEVPFLQLTFRLVPEGQGSLAQGFQQTMSRFIGFIPAAPLFGSLIDKSCKLWHVDECTGESTSCLEYDNHKFKYYFWGVAVVTKVLSFFFMFLAYKLYRLPDKKIPNEANESKLAKENMVAIQYGDMELTERHK